MPPTGTEPLPFPGKDLRGTHGACASRSRYQHVPVPPREQLQRANLRDLKGVTSGFPKGWEMKFLTMIEIPACIQYLLPNSYFLDLE